MSVEGMYAEARARAEAREVPEGISVVVVTTDQDVAATVAPDLARVLHPDRRIGRVLHVGDTQELLNVQGIEVVVTDLGPKGAR